MSIGETIKDLRLLQKSIDALRGKTIVIENRIERLDDPTYYDRLWREHLKPAFERDAGRRVS